MGAVKLPQTPEGRALRAAADPLIQQLTRIRLARRIRLDDLAAYVGKPSRRGTYGGAERGANIYLSAVRDWADALGVALLAVPERDAQAYQRPHVRVDPAQHGGKPNVGGVLATVLADELLDGVPAADVARGHGLRRGDVLVAAWYLGLHGDDKYQDPWYPWALRAADTMAMADPDRDPDYATICDPPTGGPGG